MKKLFLAISLMFLLVACGVGPYEANTGGETFEEYSLIGPVGILSLPASSIDISPTKNAFVNGSLVNVSWNIVENTGGDGNIQVAHTTYGGDCSLALPTETIPVVGGQLSIGYTSLLPSTITTINNLLAGMSSYRVCFTINNLSTTQPLNVRVRVKMNTKGSIKVGI